MRLKNMHIWLIIGVVFFSGIAIAADKILGEITPGKYILNPINNHLPNAIEDPDDYRKSLQKVELELGNQERFRDLPELGMKRPYTGVIKLGMEPREFGVIVDVRAEEKRLYVDTNGDGSFQDEPWIELLNEWYGLETYWVIGPEPIKLQMGYDSELSRSQTIDISVSGFLNRPGALVKEKPYLLIMVRTWFLAELLEDGAPKIVAVTDCNNNGIYNDPKDALFIDYNDDGFFSNDEVMIRKEGIKIKSGNKNLNIDWEAFPRELVIGGQSGG